MFQQNLGGQKFFWGVVSLRLIGTQLLLRGFKLEIKGVAWALDDPGGGETTLGPRLRIVKRIEPKRFYS